MRDFHGIQYRLVDDDSARRAFAAIDYFLRDVSRGFGRIQNGQVPDASGRSLSSAIDLNDYLFLPGKSGGQTLNAITADLSPVFVINAPTVGTILQRWKQGSTTPLDLTAVANGAATDYQFGTLASGAGVQFVVNVAGSGIRITNQAGISGLIRGFVEAGPTSLSMAITGFNGATGTSLHNLFSYGTFNTWDGTALTNAMRVGFNTDPYDYRSSAAASQPGSVVVARMTGATATVPTMVVEGSSSSTEMALAIANSSGGTAPSRAIASAIGGFRHNGHLVLFNNSTAVGLVHGANNVGAATVVFNVQDAAATPNGVLTIGTVAAWSDTLAAASSLFGLAGYTSGAHRAFLLASGGFNPFTRFGISSAYTLISNGQAAAAGFMAPEATPSVLRVVNAATTGADGSVLLKLQSLRSGQSGDFLDIINQAGTTLVKVDSTGKLTTNLAYLGTAGSSLSGQDVTIGVATQGSAGGLYVDDGSTFVGQITTAAGGLTANRSYAFPDASGTVILTGASVSLSGNANSIFISSTASSGACFSDTTTATKKLRFVLSGGVGNNSITLTNTAARNYGLGNLGGNIVIVGDQTTAVSAGRMEKVDLVNQAAAIGATNLTNSPPAGYYVIHYTLLETASDVTAGTIQFQINYTDDIGATTQVGTAIPLTGLGALRDRGTFEVQVASGNISYQTNLTGIVGTSKYSLYVRIEFMG